MNIRRMGMCFAFALVIIIPSQILAAGKINFGNFSIVPGVTLDGVYDDNIYKGNGKTYPIGSTISTTAAEKKDFDITSHVRPSLFFNYTMPSRGLVSLGYRGDFALYNINSSNDWKSNSGSLDVDYKAPGGLIFGLTELYSKSEDPYGSADQYGIGRTTKRYTNSIKTKAGYSITRTFRTILHYSNDIQKYDSDLDYSQNYTTNEFGVSLDVQVLPKTWSFARYSYGTQKYDSNAPGQTDDTNSDASRQKASVGLTWDEGAKFSGEVSLGYEWLQFDHLLTPTGTVRYDTAAWAAATSVNYQATATTSLGLTLTRTIRTTASDTNENFVDTTIGFNLRQQLLRKLGLNAGATYSLNDYNVAPAGAVGGDSRSDTNYMANIGINYDIADWLGVGVVYSYSRKDSNYEANEYVDNQFTATVKVVY